MRDEGIILAMMAVVAVSGCVKGLQDPDPVIENPEQRQGALDIVAGETSVAVDVRNRAYAGDVRVILTVLDGNRTVLEEYSEIFRMEENETRRLTISAQVPEEAQTYTVSVRNAD
jgi:hypothetical protein